MDILSTYCDAQAGAFETLVVELAALPDTGVAWLTPDGVLLHKEGALILIVRFQPQLDKILAQTLKELAKRQLNGTGVEVIQVGGDTPQAMETADKNFPQGYFQAYHLPDQGPLWTGPRSYHGPLARHLAQRPTHPPEWEKFHAKVHALIEERRELSGFAHAMASRRVIMTPLILGGLVLWWGLEVLAGAPWTPALVRMGAQVPLLVEQGEAWRLISYAWLHGDWMHIGFNGLVVYRMGMSLERVLGGSRFMVLYVLSALGGGLAGQFVLGDIGITTGASGAIWGLLGADAIMVLRNQGILPESLVVRNRSMVVQNILLNVVISFHPQVNWACHLGGGLVGALLMLSGLFNVGLPRWGKGETQADQTPLPMHLAAALCALVYLACGLVGPLFGKPMELTQAPLLIPKEIPDLGIKISLPSGLSLDQDPEAVSTPGTQSYGWLLSDPVEMHLMVEETHQPLQTEGMAMLQPDLEAALGVIPEWLTVSVPIRTDIHAGRPISSVTWVAENGISIEHAVTMLPGENAKIIHIEVIQWKDGMEGWNGLALKLAESIQAP